MKGMWKKEHLLIGVLWELVFGPLKIKIFQLADLDPATLYVSMDILIVSFNICNL